MLRDPGERERDGLLASFRAAAHRDRDRFILATTRKIVPKEGAQEILDGADGRGIERKLRLRKG